MDFPRPSDPDARPPCGDRRVLPWNDPSLPSRIARLVASTIRAGAPRPVASTERELAEAEAALGVPLPPDLRLYLLATGGASVGATWRGLWRVPEVVSLNRSLPVFRWFPGIVGIGNEGFLARALDYRRGAAPPVVTLGLSSSDDADVAPEAESFADWLAASLPAPGGP
jgi:hypothetical protein